MKSILLVLLTIVIIHSCGNHQDNIRNYDSTTVASAIAKEKVKASPHWQGLKELQLFENKYLRHWEHEPKVFPYSSGHTFRVFELHCPNECFKAEFNSRISLGTEIPKKDFLTLVDLLKNPNSYGNSTAACYHPRFGLVVYDNERIPLESMSICLECNSYDTYPGAIDVVLADNTKQGFSKKTRTSLKQMFSSWGFDYNMHSLLWDE
ncbi:hypothetical protein N9B82_05130 [Saprospiraceae bacterium]|nr:hypothetical protein [Saprospiraceae bacterium]